MRGFNVTYDIVTDESAKNGDTAESGFISQDVSLRDAMADLFATRTNRVDSCGGFIECNEYPVKAPSWVTVGNGVEFETGAVESRSLHIPAHVTAASRRRIAKLCRAHGA